MWEAYAAALPPALAVAQVSTGAQSVSYGQATPGGDLGAALARAAGTARSPAPYRCRYGAAAVSAPGEPPWVLHVPRRDHHPAAAPAHQRHAAAENGHRRAVAPRPGHPGGAAPPAARDPLCRPAARSLAHAPAPGAALPAAGAAPTPRPPRLGPGARAVPSPPRCTDPGCPRTRPCPDHPPGSSPWARKMPRGWTATRARILDRDGHRCVQCGAPATEVHHADPPREDDDALVSLCGAVPRHDHREQGRRRAPGPVGTRQRRQGRAPGLAPAPRPARGARQRPAPASGALWRRRGAAVCGQVPGISRSWWRLAAGRSGAEPRPRARLVEHSCRRACSAA